MSTTELESKARQYRELQAEIKALQEQAEAVKAALIAEMDARKQDAVTAGEYTIRYIPYESTRVDTAKLKRSGLYEQYSTRAMALRFTVQ